ncbi:MAG: MFS transporter [Candidatus Competibacteraceae bacterium]|nr:MFS transporter [Candidatus Competibacteraceae bacterium]
MAPNLWGWLADRRGRRMALVRLGCLLALVCFVGVWPAQGHYGALVVVVLGFSFFWSAALAQFEVTTLNHLGRDTHRYSLFRLWGSVGFIVTALVAGVTVQSLGIGMVPALITLCLGLLLGVSLAVPEAPGQPDRRSGSLGRVLRRPAVVALLVVSLLVQASHGPYYAFFSIHLEALGYRGDTIGLLWSLGVVAEVGVFLLMHRWLPRFGARRLMLIALGLTALRWGLTAGLAASLPVLLLAQTLHAFSFGVHHATAIHLIHHFFTGPHQGRGQALYSSLSFGAGGALGSLMAGYLWQPLGALGTFALAALTAAVAWAVAYRWLGEET